MAALQNTSDSTAINAALDEEFIENFQGEYDRLAEILGIFTPETIRAGQALNMIKVTGTLNDEAGENSSSGTAYKEGDEVALSKFSATKTPVGQVEIAPYRKLTTAAAIMKSGYEVAVLGTDNKMLSTVRVATIKKFFEFLKKGTGTTSGAAMHEGLQPALAFADAALEDALETNSDESTDFVHFVNRQDAAAYLAKAPITTQNVYGMTYVENFLGVQNVFITSHVEKGKLFVTPSENIHIFGLDFASLSNAGLSYATQSNGLIGVAHTPAYDRVGTETHVINGTLLFPENQAYIVKAEVMTVA